VLAQAEGVPQEVGALAAPAGRIDPVEERDVGPLVGSGTARGIETARQPIPRPSGCRTSVGGQEKQALARGIADAGWDALRTMLGTRVECSCTG